MLKVIVSFSLKAYVALGLFFLSKLMFLLFYSLFQMGWLFLFCLFLWFSIFQDSWFSWNSFLCCLDLFSWMLEKIFICTRTSRSGTGAPCIDRYSISCCECYARSWEIPTIQARGELIHLAFWSMTFLLYSKRGRSVRYEQTRSLQLQ